VKALAAELGRMRADLGAPPAPAEDVDAAERIESWFPAGGVGNR
jgi:hypothetical protein